MFMDGNLRQNCQGLKQKNVHQKDFISIVKNFFDNLDENIDKKELEGFFSVFKYNKSGFLDSNSIARIIFEEKDEEFYQRASFKTHGPYPQKQSEVGQNSKQEYPRFNSTMIEQILKKFDDQMHSNRKSSFELFKYFDVDNDGFVSHEDFKNKIKQSNLLNKDETKQLIDYLDPEDKGSLNYTDFSRKIRVNVNNTYDQGSQKVIPYNAPFKEHVQKFRQQLPYVKESYKEFQKKLRPEQFYKLKTNTRFSSTPNHQNTFVNVYGKEDSAMYINEKERLQQNANKSTLFQMIEQQIQKKKNQAKLSRIAAVKNNFQRTLDEKLTQQEEKYQKSLETKGNAKWTYEHRTHLKNFYM